MASCERLLSGVLPNSHSRPQPVSQASEKRCASARGLKVQTILPRDTSEAKKSPLRSFSLLTLLTLRWRGEIIAR